MVTKVNELKSVVNELVGLLGKDVAANVLLEICVKVRKDGRIS